MLVTAACNRRCPQHRHRAGRHLSWRRYHFATTSPVGICSEQPRLWYCRPGSAGFACGMIYLQHRQLCPISQGLAAMFFLCPPSYKQLWQKPTLLLPLFGCLITPLIYVCATQCRVTVSGLGCGESAWQPHICVWVREESRRGWKARACQKNVLLDRVSAEGDRQTSHRVVVVVRWRNLTAYSGRYLCASSTEPSGVVVLTCARSSLDLSLLPQAARYSQQLWLLSRLF